MMDQNFEFGNGIQYVVRSLFRELDVIRSIESELKQAEDGVHVFNYGNAPVTLFTSDIEHCGAFAVYLAKQLEGTAVCCIGDASLDDIKSKLTGNNNCIVNIGSFEDEDATIEVDPENWNDSSLIMRKIKFIITKPFTEDGVSITPIKDKLTRLDQLGLDNKIINFRFNQDALYYNEDGPKFKSYVLIYVIYGCLNDNVGG